jgi:Sulfatase
LAIAENEPITRLLARDWTKVRWILEATGAALLLMLPYFCPLILPFDLALYHHHLPLRSVGGGILLDMLGTFALGALLIFAIARLSPTPRRIAAACLASLVFWRIAGLLIELDGLWHSSLVSPEIPQKASFYWIAINWWNHWHYFVEVAFLPLLPLLAWFRPHIARPVVQAARLSLAGFAFCALWIIPQLFHDTYVRNPRQPHGIAFAQSRDNSGKRVVWILFDELSYDLLFDHRPAWLRVSNFEKLQSKSFSFGNLEPIGLYTERIIPSLLSGRPIDQIRSGEEGTLSYWDQVHHQWVAFDPNESLFGLANSSGWNPGVAGWYNPYCRIFRSVLVSCKWRPGVFVELPIEMLGASPKESAVANALLVPRIYFARFSPQSTTLQQQRLKRSIEDYQIVMHNASDLLRNEQARFVFIHLPVPHPPGIYDRATHKLSESGNYLDNLVLADDTLGTLLQQIGETPSAAQTTLIISSDHSWRVPMWRLSPGWTDEEEQISRGRFDTRPVFLIHFPGQSSGSVVNTAMPELAEHDIIAAILNNEISRPDQLAAFLRSSTQQRGY